MFFEPSNHNLPSKEVMRYNSHTVRWSIQTVGEIVLYDASMSCTNIGEDPFNDHQRKSNTGENVFLLIFDDKTTQVIKIMFVAMIIHTMSTRASSK